LALGWALYGLYQVMIVITGRVRATRRNLPAAAAGLACNVALLFALVPSGGLGLGIAGAGIALCGAYVVMVAAMYALTRNLFAVGFQWRRLARLVALLAAVAVSGELALPTSGAAGLLSRIAWLALIPAALLLTRFFDTDERAQARVLLADVRSRFPLYRNRRAEAQAYADDPLRDL